MPSPAVHTPELQLDDQLANKFVDQLQTFAKTLEATDDKNLIQTTDTIEPTAGPNSSIYRQC